MSDIFVFICTKTTVDVALPTSTSNQADFNRRVSNAFRASGRTYTVGDLKLRPNGDAIPNHLLCDGSEVSRTQFSELFAFLGEAEGAGDGATTFNLPNYVGDALSVPESAPSHAVTPQGTIDQGFAVGEPATQGEIGGTQGGNVISGGKTGKVGE